MLRSADFNHLNPTKFKIPFPILRCTSKRHLENNHQNCFSIQKFRHKSLTNIDENLFFNKPSGQRTKNGCNQPETKLSKSIIPSVQENDKMKNCFDELLRENGQLMDSLMEKEKNLTQMNEKYEKIQDKYTRLLEVTNQKSEEQIEMLMSSHDENASRSKIRHSVISEKASILRNKLDKLDLSNINHKQGKESMFLSEVHLI